MSDTYYAQDGASAAGTAPASSSVTSAQSQNPNEDAAQEKTQGDEVITSSMLRTRLEELERKLQSRTDKVVSGLDKRVAQAQGEAQKAIDLLKGTGRPLTADEEAQIRQNAVNRALMDPAEDRPTQASPQANQSGNAIAQYVNNELIELQQKAGVYISPEELRIRLPEFSKLKPHEAISEFAKLVDERKASNQSSPAARLPYTQTGTVNGNEALKVQYEQELRNLPKVGNRGDQLAKLKARYQAKGLDIT